MLSQVLILLIFIRYIHTQDCGCDEDYNYQDYTGYSNNLSSSDFIYPNNDNQPDSSNNYTQIYSLPPPPPIQPKVREYFYKSENPQQPWTGHNVFRGEDGNIYRNYHQNLNRPFDPVTSSSAINSESFLKPLKRNQRNAMKDSKKTNRLDPLDLEYAYKGANILPSYIHSWPFINPRIITPMSLSLASLNTPLAAPYISRIPAESALQTPVASWYSFMNQPYYGPVYASPMFKRPEEPTKTMKTTTGEDKEETKNNSNKVHGRWPLSLARTQIRNIRNLFRSNRTSTTESSLID